MAEGKVSRPRIALALLCSLAVACTLMYITADGNDVDEVVKNGYSSYSTHTVVSRAVERAPPARVSSKNIERVVSWDVEKTQKIYTNIKDHGRIRLLDYLTEIEKKIAVEVAGRKQDVASIRVQMAKNREYNRKARNSMKKMLMERMAKNAKRAKAELDKQMRWTAKTFKHHAEVANRRNNANIARSKATRAIMRKNKRKAQKALHRATLNQQHALAALDAATNSKIRQTNKHIGANSAQIKINAKKARDALHRAMGRFNHKMFHVNEQAKKGRSKISALSIQMDKRTRAMIAGKIKAIAVSTAAQFRKVRATMARDRAHADAMLKQATTKMAAALNAQKVLQNKRYAKTVADIAAAKKEAKDRVAKATSYFKVNLLHLSSVVKHQVTKLNGRVTQLQGVVTKNRLEQARVNRNVAAETKRMIKLGNKREAQLATNDKKLRGLMAKNKAASNSRMQRMANSFNAAIHKIRHQMKKARAFHAHQLKKKTAELYGALAKQAAQQKATNQKLTAQTRRARMDAVDALRAAKRNFAGRLGALHSTIVKNDRKADGRIKHLAGVESRNALKSAKGREMLKMLSQSNKNELKTAVRNMVHKGEMHALKVEKHAKAMNKKTLAALNQKISTEISVLAKKTHASIEDLRLNSAKARAEMKREILYAVRSAAALAKKNLRATVKASNAQFAKMAKKQAASAHASASARAALRAGAAAEKRRAVNAIRDAVANQNKALLALKEETAKKIKKSNKNLDAHARQMKKNAAQVAAQMKANLSSLTGKVDAARSAAKRGLNRANAASVARHRYALKRIKGALNAAKKDSDKKFRRVYKKMASDRARADQNMGRAVGKLNDAIAKRSALYDARFRKTVKNIALARKAAFLQVVAAKKDFSTEIASVTASVKDQETRLQGEIAVVSAMVASNRAQQVRVNRRVNGELKRIVKLADTRHTTNNKARARIRQMMNRNKAIAHQEVKALANKTGRSLRKLRGKMAKYRRQAATDLSKATKKMYGTLSEYQLAQAAKFKHLRGSLGKARVQASAAINRAKKDFKAKLTTLTNTVTSNNNKFERGLMRVTGVAHSWKKAAGADRALLKRQVKSIESDLNKSVIRAIQIGEARGKAVEERAHANIGAMKKALQGEIASRLERAADRVFKTIKQNRAKIADNYLALKAYCGASAGKIIDYTTKGRGRGLNSVGDFLTTIASLSVVRTKGAEGLGAGGKSVPPLFGGKKQKVSNALDKTNGLVNEYSKALALVRQRWPYGLGHYLLGKIQASMQGPGLLAIGKVADKAGQFVYVNGRAIGLSNKLSDFDNLACRLHTYQAKLAKMTKKMPKAVRVSHKKFFAHAPEWQGN